MTGLPHDLHAEAAVLGAVLLSPAALTEARQAVTAQDFYRGAHGTIFDAACGLAARGNPVDPVTLTDELDRLARLAHVGGAKLISDLVADVPTAANVLYYARIVADHARRRRLADAATRAAGSACDLAQPLAETMTELRASLDEPSGRSLRLYSMRELDGLPRPEWLIEGHIPFGVGLIYGQSGSLKSFLSISFAASVATGLSWFGHQAKRGNVVYVAAEGADGFRARKDAWVKVGADLDQLYLVREFVDLLDARQAANLSQAVRSVDARLLVIDTLSRCMGGDENSTQDMRNFVAACDRIRAERDCAILIVHHQGVEDGRPRGNTALYAACDVVIATKLAGKGEVSVVNDPPRGKQKDAPPFSPWRLRFQPVQGTGSGVLVAAGGRQEGLRVIEALRSYGAVNWPGLLRIANGDGEVIRELVASKKVVKLPDGRYGLSSLEDESWKAMPL